MLLVCLGSVPLSADPNRQPTSEVSAVLVPRSESHGPLLLASITAVSIATYFLYKKSSYLTDKGKELKIFLLENVAFPLYVHFDRIRDEGVSKEDLAVAAASVLVLYGAKKTGDRYHVWNSVLDRNFDKTRESVKEDAVFAYDHKGKIALGLVSAAALAWLIRAGWNLPIVERFRRSLTSKQHETIASDDTLRTLLDNAHEDPMALQEHPDFSSQLHERQKALLDEAVEEYKGENDPMSLFDDLDFSMD